MQDTMANPFTAESPIGASLRNLSQIVTRAPSEAQRIFVAEKALAARRENENRASLGDMFQQYGTPGYDPAQATNMAVRAGISPDHLGGFDRYNAATRYGATDQRTTNAAVGAGQAYSSTAGGFRESEAGTDRRAMWRLGEDRYQFDSKPMTVGTDQGPVIMRQSEAFGRPAVEDLGKVKGDAARRALNAPGGLAAADETTQRFVGAGERASTTPKNYVFQGKNFITNDGVSDARTGQPLPQGGYLATAQGDTNAVGLNSSVTTDLQKQDISNQRFKNLVGFTRNLAQADANNFGVAGIAKGFMQDAQAVAGNVAQGLGYSGVQEAVNTARQKAMAGGVDPGLLSGVFDPKLPALYTAADLMVFSAAEALAGQQGRSVSNKDVAVFKNIVGDPAEWTGNQQKFLAKLDTVEQILAMNQGVVDQRLRGGAPSAAAQAAPGVAQPPGAAPGAPPIPAGADPLAAARDAITRGADRNAVIRRLQQNGINPTGL